MPRALYSLNRREDEFNTLLDYNNYLEDAEEITFNLLNNIDVALTEKKLAAYRSQYGAAIARNAALSSQEHTSFEARQAAEKEQVRLRREAARQEDVDEKVERERDKTALLDRLAAAKEDPDQIVKDSQKVQLKRSTARRTAEEKAQQNMRQLEEAQVDYGSNAGNGSATSSFLIRGLKPIEVAEPEKPYDPFGGIDLGRDYYYLQDHYDNQYLDRFRKDQQFTAGGYDLGEYYARTMFEAFSGLGCSIQDEMAARGVTVDKSLATVAAVAATGGGDASMDDVF